MDSILVRLEKEDVKDRKAIDFLRSPMWFHMLLSMWLSSCAEIQERDKVNDKNRNPEEILELQLTSYNAIPANLSLKSVKSKSSRHILMGMGEKKSEPLNFPWPQLFW